MSDYIETKFAAAIRWLVLVDDLFARIQIGESNVKITKLPFWGIYMVHRCKLKLSSEHASCGSFQP